MAGPVSIAAAALIITEQLIGLAIGRPPQSEAAESVTEPIVTVYAALDLAAFCLLLLALTGLYERQSRASGGLGLIGYLVAFVGTVLAAGDWWFELFAVPYYADVAPNAFDEHSC